jgi:5-methyltetrahydropteroyltriglutamate--homocysteine methyltransferase
MTLATIPGYPRIGKHRELKRALEAYWAGKLSAGQLEQTAGEIRRADWATQREAGLDVIPVNDFSLYDNVLDAAVLVGAIPSRFGWHGERVDLDTRFALARGRVGQDGAPALELTKWFDTNYHYLVPELSPDQVFRLADDKPFAELDEARAAGIGDRAKVVLLGPLSFLLLSKPADEEFDRLSLFDRLLPVYAEIVGRLATMGAPWIAFDEPCLVQDRSPQDLAALAHAYETIAAAKGGSRLLVQTYFGHVGEAYPTLIRLPIDGIGLDLVRGPQHLDLIAQHGFPQDKWLAAGVVDGRNVWVNDLDASLATLRRLTEVVPPDRLMVSTSCSLLFVPHDVAQEETLDPEVRPWLAFAEQKLAEVGTLTRALNGGEAAVDDELGANRATRQAMATSPRRRNPAVRERAAAQPADADRRARPYAERRELQAERLRLPPLPTTTIGSFPQTGEIRASRRRFESGELSAEAYDAFIEGQIRAVVAEQEALGLDVLVHGEPERNDMVQYFAEQLDGFVFTHNGWVQSYGSRCVRPPIVAGDVRRPTPMTLRWATFAQGLTERPVKGMLTGPVTILNWSFVRDDQPRAETCAQIALAIRDEVADLDAAGIAAIQIDEPALREGLPLRRAEQADYLAWATRCFRLAAAGARPETQLHTHMCYSEFGEIIEAIEALDADVLSIENARSGHELLEIFRERGYGQGIGPGVYDVHSPRVPPAEEVATALRAILGVLDPTQVWVNPDCGLKTRRPEEVRPALTNLAAAARAVRQDLTADG